MKFSTVVWIVIYAYCPPCVSFTAADTSPANLKDLAEVLIWSVWPYSR